MSCDGVTLSPAGHTLVMATSGGIRTPHAAREEPPDVSLSTLFHLIVYYMPYNVLYIGQQVCVHTHRPIYILYINIYIDIYSSLEWKRIQVSLENNSCLWNHCATAHCRPV